MLDVFSLLSWCGVMLLMTAHLCISLGSHKAAASRLSAAGAISSIIAAYGMGIWSVLALNIAWAAISIAGSRIEEQFSPRPIADKAVIFLAMSAAALWVFGPQPVAWACSAIYVLGWLSFSLGVITRQSYLVACVIAGVVVVPALWLLGAHAFATNEAFGAIVGALGVWRLTRGASAIVATNAAPAVADPTLA